MQDILLTNGTILTMNDSQPQVEAVLIRAGNIAACGDFEAVQAQAAPDYQTINLDGRCALPGFHDSHLHLMLHGLQLSRLDFASTPTLEAALEQVAQKAASVPTDTWILGAGFSVVRWGKQSLSKSDLDRVAPNHPVFIYSQDFHSCWVNSRALEAANIHAGTPDPAQGKIVRDDSGEPSGTLLELAANLVTDIIPKPSDEAMDEALEAAAIDLAGYGVTTVHTMGYEPQSYWRHIAKTASKDDYGLRVWSCIPHKYAEAALELGLATGQGGSRFQVGGAKFFADGALGSLTAWMLEPYQNSNNYGIQVDDPKILAERFPLVIEAGLTPVVHAIGDAANRAVLDALEATQSLWQAKGMRPRIEHAQHLHPDDIPRFAQLGVIASVQPYHLVIDAPNARKIIPNKLAGTYAFGSLAKYGAHLALGSDTPVAVPGVLKAIRAAVTRIDAEGLVFQENETLDVARALRGYTTDAAYAIHAEHRSGQLNLGFDADVVVLSHNPLDGNLDALEVHGTMLAGTWTKVLD